MESRKTTQGSCTYRKGGGPQARGSAPQTTSAPAMAHGTAATMLRPASERAAAAAALAAASKPSASTRVSLSAYAKDFQLVTTHSGETSTIPLELQRTEGAFAFQAGVATIPLDGYYMLLWELGVTRAQGSGKVKLGINQTSTQLTHGLQEGYDAGQQVTWFSAGDHIRLLVQAESDGAELKGGSAQLTIIRLG